MRLILSIVRTLLTLVIMVMVIKFVYTFGPSPFPQLQSGTKGSDSVQPGNNAKNGTETDVGNEDKEKKGGPAEGSLPSQPPATEKEKTGADTGGSVADTKSQNPSGYFMTMNEVFAIENISLADKLAGLAILGKLKQGDIETVFNMSEDGITYSEFDQIKAMLSKTLNAKEIDKLNSILMKNKQLYAQGKLGK